MFLRPQFHPLGPPCAALFICTDHHTMKPTRNNTSQVSYRMDPLGKTRIAWIVAQGKAHKERLYPSVILRRALAVYVSHLESILDEPLAIAGEMTALRMCSLGGDLPPWKYTPDFNEHPGKPLSEYINERTKRRDPTAWMDKAQRGDHEAANQEGLSIAEYMRKKNASPAKPLDPANRPKLGWEHYCEADIKRRKG